MIKAEIVADSVNPDGRRITSMVWEYPRYIHSEIMTHRVFSRNAASSRAIPVAKMMGQVENNPVIPSEWSRNAPGMQGKGVFEGDDAKAIENAWLTGRSWALATAKGLMDCGLHKQVANRVLEPWMWMKVIVTATEWENFFSLRVHKDAHPDFRLLAFRVLEQYVTHEPEIKEWDQWHIPWDNIKPSDTDTVDRLKIATARCARVSYLNFEGKNESEKDFELHDRLQESGHWSPFEHCAQTWENWWNYDCGNFKGWRPYRKEFYSESRTVTNLKELYEQAKQEFGYQDTIGQR